MICTSAHLYGPGHLFVLARGCIAADVLGQLGWAQKNTNMTWMRKKLNDPTYISAAETFWDFDSLTWAMPALEALLSQLQGIKVEKSKQQKEQRLLKTCKDLACQRHTVLHTTCRTVSLPRSRIQLLGCFWGLWSLSIQRNCFWGLWSRSIQRNVEDHLQTEVVAAFGLREASFSLGRPADFSA